MSNTEKNKTELKTQSNESLDLLKSVKVEPSVTSNRLMFNCLIIEKDAKKSSPPNGDKETSEKKSES